VLDLNQILGRLDNFRDNDGQIVADYKLAEMIGIDKSLIGKWRKTGKASQSALKLAKAWLDTGTQPEPDWIREAPEIDEKLANLQSRMAKLIEISRQMGIEMEKMGREIQGLKGDQYQQDVLPMGTKDNGE
jgi:hypothetical protein